MEIQTMVKRPLIFFIKISIINKILAVTLEGLFWATNKVECSFGFGHYYNIFESQQNVSITTYFFITGNMIP